jgi:hypothetical protein
VSTTCPIEEEFIPGIPFIWLALAEVFANCFDEIWRDVLTVRVEMTTTTTTTAPVHKVTF